MRRLAGGAPQVVVESRRLGHLHRARNKTVDGNRSQRRGDKEIALHLFLPDGRMDFSFKHNL